MVVVVVAAGAAYLHTLIVSTPSYHRRSVRSARAELFVDVSRFSNVKRKNDSDRSPPSADLIIWSH